MKWLCLTALLLLCSCATPTEPVTAPNLTTWPTGTITKNYTLGGKQFTIHILPKPSGPVASVAPNLQQCYQEPGGNQSVTPLINFSVIRPNLGACGGSGGGGTLTGTYVVNATCSSPGASIECALKALGLTISAGTIAGSCMASWTGAAAVACASLISGFGGQAQGYLQTPDCRTCLPPPDYPTLRPAPGYTGWEPL